MKIKALVTQLCLALWGPMDCSLPGCSVCHSPGKNTGMVVIPFSRGSSAWRRDWTQVLPHCREIRYLLSYQGSPLKLMDRFNCTKNFNRVFLVEFDEFILKSTRKNNEVASTFLKINSKRREFTLLPSSRISYEITVIKTVWHGAKISKTYLWKFGICPKWHDKIMEKGGTVWLTGEDKVLSIWEKMKLDSFFVTYVKTTNN